MNQQQPVINNEAMNSGATTFTFHKNSSKNSVNSDPISHNFSGSIFFEISHLEYFKKKNVTNTPLSASTTDPPYSSGMYHQPIRRPQLPSRLNTLPLEEIQLTAQVASSQQALH